MRAFVRITAAALFGLAATACNVTPQELPPSTSGGNPGGANGGSTGVTRGGNGSSTGASETSGGSSSGSGSGGSTGGVSSSSSGGSSGGTTGALDGGADAGFDAGFDAGPPAPTGIEFVGTANPFLGVNYQASFSVTPVNTFFFRVSSADDAGVWALPVTFTPGSSNAAGSVMLDANGNPVDSGIGQPPTETFMTDGKGDVSVQLQSGTQAGQVSLTATITLPNGTQTSANGSSTVIGTQPSVANSGISCGPTSATPTSLENLAVYSGGNLPCQRNSSYAGTTTCTVTLGDRFGNAVGVPVPVHFYAEAGLWQNQQLITPAYGQPNPGVVSNTLKTQNAGLPVDVDPLPANGGLAAEPSYNGSCLTQGSRTFNPRDGLVTIMASFTGEEPFTVTSSGVWTPGTTFVDMPQPFVDNKDSSSWEAGDICAGTSTNGVCDGPNGTWDGNANVWVETWILYTGDPAFTTWTPDPAPPVQALATQGKVTWSDINLNLPASQTVCDVSAPSAGEPQGFQLSYPVSPQKPSPADGWGMNVAQVETCDAGTVPLPDGGAVANQICSYQTVVANFSGGFTNSYSVSETTYQDAGLGSPPGAPYCLNSSCQLFSDSVLTAQVCGTAIGP